MKLPLPELSLEGKEFFVTLYYTLMAVHCSRFEIRYIAAVLKSKGARRLDRGPTFGYQAKLNSRLT